MNTQNTQIHQPLVSVMIPYYNCQDYIAETIESVEQQTYPNVEIIIVNDGSAQEHTDYLKQLLLNKPHVQYYFQQNKGLAATRNAAAQYAKGTYFLFLDADDVILPTYVEQSVALLEQNQDYQVVYPISEYFGAKTGIWELPPYHQYQDLLLTNRLPCIAVHRAEDFHRIGGFDDSLPTHEDWDYWIRMLANGNKVYQIQEILFRYRQRHNASSLIDGLLRDNNLLKKDIQRVYVKNSEIFAKHDLSYWDLCQLFWENQSLSAHNAELHRVKEQIIVEAEEIRLKHIHELQDEFRDTLHQINQEHDKIITQFNQKIAEMQYQADKQAKMLSMKCAKPFMYMENHLKSLNEYRKWFRLLVKDKGSFKEAVYISKKVYQRFGLNGLKEFLKSKSISS